MFRFETTTDYDLATRIIADAWIYPQVIDDFSPPREQYRAPENPAVWYVLAYDDDELLGMWVMAPANAICAEIHTCLFRTVGARRACRAAKAWLAWVWERTPFWRLTTYVPSDNPLALKYALREMAVFGVDQGSIRRGGTLLDRIWLGVSRPKDL